MAANAINILITAKDEASKVLQSLSGNMQATGKDAGGFSDSLGRIRDVALGVYLPQLGAKIVDVGKNAISSAGDFEQYRVAFETMLGSADKARSLLSDISNFAKETPFELPEVVTASKQLLAFGFAQDQIIPTMRRLGDIASGVGVPVGQLAYVFGQVRVAGKLMGGDLMQFTNAGVPMIEGLSKVLKVSQSDVKKMVEEGKVGFSDVEKVINNMTDSGSQFGGMMQKQSGTFKGVMSNISDAFGQMLRSAVGISNTGDIAAGSIFDRLKNAATNAMPVLQRMAANAGKAAGDAMTAFSLLYTTISGGDPTLNKSQLGFVGYVKWLLKTRDIVLEVTGVLEKTLGPSLKALWQSFQDRLLPSLEKLLPYLDDVAKIAGGILVGALWIAINALNIFVSVISGTIDIFFKAKDAIGASIDWIAQKANWFKDNWLSVVTQIIGFVALLPLKLPFFAGEAIAKMVMALISVKWSDVFSGLWNAAKEAFDKVQNAFVAIWQYLHDLKWSDIFIGIAKSIGNALIAMIEGAVKGALRGLPGHLENHFNLPRFALGTDYAPGGLSIVGENGPEIVNLPKGSQVVPANKTAGMMQSAGRGVNIENYNVYNQADSTFILRDIGWRLANS